jgi:hypothetical protein
VEDLPGRKVAGGSARRVDAQHRAGAVAVLPVQDPDLRKAIVGRISYMAGFAERLTERLSHLPPTFTSHAASAVALSSRDLAMLREAGEIDELSRGVYRRADAEPTAHLDLSPSARGPARRHHLAESWDFPNSRGTLPLWPLLEIVHSTA